MTPRVLLGLLVLAALAVAVSRAGGPSDIACGPVQGALPAGDGPARVSAQTARAAALVAVPGAVVADVDLDEEDGFLVYEVELRHARAAFDVVVDAGTGEVLCTERD